MTSIVHEKNTRIHKHFVPEGETLVYDPIDLLYETDLTRTQFAECLGLTDKDSVDRWVMGTRKPSAQTKRLCAEIRQRWVLQQRLASPF